MPNVIRKIKNKDLYSVKNTETGVVHSKGSSYEDAERQLRLLNMKEGTVKKRFGGKKPVVNLTTINVINPFK
jgi:hypothetical protein